MTTNSAYNIGYGLINSLPDFVKATENALGIEVKRCFCETQA